MKIVKGTALVMIHISIKGVDHFSKKRDEHRVRWGKEPLRKTEERYT